MPGNRKPQQLPPPVAENKKCEESLKGNRRNYKEINRRDPVSVVVKEGLPCLRWSTLPRYHVLRDRRLGDVEAEPQKLAVDNRLVSLTPKRVFNAANGVSDVTLDLVAFAFALELAVSGQLPGDFLHFALCLFGGAFDPVLVNHGSSPLL
jgi:hypothetical protein